MDDWKPRANIMIEYGVRQDWDELLHRAAFSPRVSAAWAPFASKNTKFLAGYAVLRDETPLPLFVRPQDQYSMNYFLNPALPTQVDMFEIPDSHLEFPEFQNWTVGLEQRLPKKTILKLNGIHKRGQNGLVYTPGATPGIFDLTNAQRSSYDAAEVEVDQHLAGAYEWMASYTRSRAYSNEVIDLNVDQPLTVVDNAGRLSWDAPNRFVTWAYLPTKWKNWAVAFSAEARTGFPYSVVNGDGEIVGAVNSARYPMFFSLNLHPEWKFRAFGRRWALRGGLNNLTNHQNPNVVETVPGMPPQFFGSEGRHFVVRIRWLGKAN
jgi:TonB dependent receptor